MNYWLLIYLAFYFAVWRGLVSEYGKRDGAIAALIFAALGGLSLLHLDLPLIGGVTAIGLASYFLFWRLKLKRHGFFWATAYAAWFIFVGLALDYGPDPKTIFAFVERHWETIVEPRWEALGHRGQTYFIVMVPLVVCFARILPEIAKKRRERAKRKARMQARAWWDENSLPSCPPSPDDLERAHR